MSAFDYDVADRAERYDSARALSPDTISQWMNELTAQIPPSGVSRILDIGCGTGRFSAALARTFRATVYGVDPALKALAIAAQKRGLEDIQLIQGPAEAIPLHAHSVDLIFLSMVLHHIGSKPDAFGEFSRVLKYGGRLCIREATRESMASYLWLSFFPEAAAIEAGRVLPRSEIAALASASGFILEAHRTVVQLLAGNLNEYQEKIARRGMSSLQMIPDAAFASGLDALRQHCATADTAAPVYEDIDLFIFRNAATAT